MTHRQLHHQSPPQPGDSSQSWEPGAHCTARRQLRQLSVLENVFSRLLCLFQAAGLISASSRQLGWPQSSLQLSVSQRDIPLLWHGNLVNLVSLRDFLKPF